MAVRCDRPDARLGRRRRLPADVETLPGGRPARRRQRAPLHGRRHRLCAAPPRSAAAGLWLPRALSRARGRCGGMRIRCDRLLRAPARLGSPGRESEQGTLGERRLHPHRGEHAGEWRGARHDLGDHPGLDVLDLGCGDGTTALPAARLGANVLGVDIATNLVEAGNARAQSLGLTNCRFQEGDASDLNEIADDSFDLVVSIFGAMFAPRPLEVAKEMVRVTRPAGRIVMGNWIPNDPTLVAQILKISSSYSPPPPEGFVSPMTWGIEDKVVERFTAAGVSEQRISFERDTYVFNFSRPPSELL